MPDWLGALPNNDHIQCCWPTQCWWKTVLLSAEHKRCGNREGAFRGSERGGKAWVWWWMSRLLWDYDWWREKNCWYDGENEGSQTRSCSGGIKMFYLRRWKKIQCRQDHEFEAGNERFGAASCWCIHPTGWISVRERGMLKQFHQNYTAWYHIIDVTHL